MKWTVTCRQSQKTNAVVKYAVEANSKEEAKEIYREEGLIINTSYEDEMPVELASIIEDVSPYKRKDEKSLYFLVLKYRNKKHMMIVEKDLTYKKACDKAKEWKEILEEENISNDMKAEKIFIVKQEPNFGEEICLEM